MFIEKLRDNNNLDGIYFTDSRSLMHKKRVMMRNRHILKISQTIKIVYGEILRWKLVMMVCKRTTLYMNFKKFLSQSEFDTLLQKKSYQSHKSKIVDKVSCRKKKEC